jgi:hypothetical protein
VLTDALMMSIMIDTWERCDVATADVAGAYIHAELDDFTLLKMEGESVDIMCGVCEHYKDFFKYETIFSMSNLAFDLHNRPMSVTFPVLAS